MKKLIIRRLLIGLLIMLAASLLSFTVLYVAPGNPAESILRERTGADPSYQDISLFMSNNDLDGNLFSKVTRWIVMAFRFDFGKSIYTGEPVMAEFFRRLVATLQLTLISMAISTPLAIIIGVVAAAKKNKIFDHVSRILALIGLSLPDFWLGLFLMIIFSRTLRLLPAFGYGGVENLIMPVITLCVAQTASLSRIVRATMLEKLSEDYIVTARGNGLKRKMILMRYAFRNALGPIVTYLGASFGHLLAGAVVVETVFSWPGVGAFLVDAVYSRDYPVIQGFVMIIALFYVVINLVTDILYVYIDPRIRFEKG